MNTLRAVLADDHRLVRAGIRSLLKQLPEVKVVAEADNGVEAVKLCKQHQPDIALMDIAMPDLNGLDAVARITSVSPSTRVVLLSMHTNEEYVQQALENGAVGYILKDSDLTELELAIKSVARGERYLTPSVATYVIDGYRKRRQGHTPSLSDLTSRQREVLQLIAEGHSTKDIAYKLSLSVKTVETHRAALMNRLKIHDIPGLVRFAIRLGLVTADR